MAGDSMLAYLGLLSAPAQVQGVAADRVVLKTDRCYAPGLRMIVELVNEAQTFKCMLHLRVEQVQRHRDGTYTWDAELSRPLNAEELRDLGPHRPTDEHSTEKHSEENSRSTTGDC
jgi:hypothetical protein